MSTQTFKAQRRTIKIGDIPLEVAMLPDGSYCLSQTEVSAVVEKSESSIRSFRRSKRLKDILEDDFQSATLTIEGTSKPIAPVTLELAALYWYKCADEGNKKAQALVIALLKRSLYELADEAFGIKRHQQESDRLLADDLSDEGIERINAMYQDMVEQQSFHFQPESSTERELKLKIQLAQLELEREKLHHNQYSHAFAAKDIDKIGIAAWKVVFQVQKMLGLSDSKVTAQLLRGLGYGFKGQHWCTVKVVGDLWIMPNSSFDGLNQAIEQFKSGKG